MNTHYKSCKKKLMVQTARSDTELSNGLVNVSMDASLDGKKMDDGRTGTVLSGYTVITKSMIGSGM